MAEEDAPKNNYFTMSDGQFCHVLNDRIVITPKLTIIDMPEPFDGPALGSQILFGGIAVVGFALTVCFFIVGFYPLAVMTMLAGISSAIAFMRGSKYSATNIIKRASIIGVEYKVVNYGYDYFLVHYTDQEKPESGLTFKRRIAIYDSAEIIAQAVALMKAEGLLS